MADEISCETRKEFITNEDANLGQYLFVRRSKIFATTRSSSTLTNKILNFSDFLNSIFFSNFILPEMEFYKVLLAVTLMTTTLSSVAFTAPLSSQRSNAEFVIRLFLMPTRANATKEVGIWKNLLLDLVSLLRPIVSLQTKNEVHNNLILSFYRC